MNTNDTKADLSVTTFNTVVVHKDKLLDTLKANRDKHDQIFAAAVSGYWIEAQRVLDQKKIDFEAASTKLTQQFTLQKDQIQLNVNEQNKDKMGNSFSLALNFNSSWPLKFPENHLEDYSRVIDLLTYSVADKVELSTNDFDAYVRNNWSWRQGFLNTNGGYMNTLLMGVSGCLIGAQAITGCASRTTGSTPLAVSGCAAPSVTNQLGRIF
jgi:hypothetical protein